MIINDTKLIAANIETFVDIPNGVARLKASILNLAVSGKLVPQDPKEETAEQLYKYIQQERIKKDNKVKKLFPITETEIPFKIPKTWKWARLGDLGFISTGKTPSTKDEKNYGGDIPFIGPGNILNGRVVAHSKLITPKGLSASTKAFPGDVVMVCIGGTIGKTAYIEKPVAFNQQINKITGIGMFSRYLYYAMLSAYFQELILSKASGAATPIVNASKWASNLIPLPPFAEQKRIVAKVEELMQLTRKLKVVLSN